MELRLEHKWEILFDSSIVLDVEWSEKYNMMATTGFYPQLYKQMKAILN